ncbi:MAG: lipid kinase [Gammaproteobacteria bacterium]|nr:MAG: lipid kinase [Gammaproteobacteria bacterium]
MEASVNALIIINRKSRSGAEVDITEGVELLESAGFVLIQAESNSAEETAKLINRHHKNIDLVIIGGGDGSINSAAATVYKHGLSLAILPLGTANDLARSLGLPMDVLEVFKIIAANKRRKVDLGYFDGHYFFNAANIGLGVQVTHELTPEIKKRWGVFSYLRAAFAAFEDNQKFKATIRVDGTSYCVRSIQLAIGNGRFYGGGNVIDEKATIDDGVLKLYSLPPQSIWELLRAAPWLRAGKHRQLNGTFTAVGRRIEIITVPSQEIYADGEPVSKTPAVFEIIPQALNVIYVEPAGPES